MKTQVILSRFLIVSGFALGLSSVADARPMGECMGKEPMKAMADRGMPDASFHLPPHLRGLDLSDAQRDRVFDLLHAQAPTMRDQAKAIHKSQSELHQLSLSNEYSETKAKALAESSAQSIARMAQLRASVDYRIYQILTPEQRQSLSEQKNRVKRGNGQHDRDDM
jgi:protein CpxP